MKSSKFGSLVILIVALVAAALIMATLCGAFTDDDSVTETVIANDPLGVGSVISIEGRTAAVKKRVRLRRLEGWTDISHTESVDRQTYRVEMLLVPFAAQFTP